MLASCDFRLRAMSQPHSRHSSRHRLWKLTAVGVVTTVALLTLAHCPRGIESMSSIVSASHAAATGQTHTANTAKATGSGGDPVLGVSGTMCPPRDTCPPGDAATSKTGSTDLLRALWTVPLLGIVLLAYRLAASPSTRGPPRQSAPHTASTGQELLLQLCVIRR